MPFAFIEVILDFIKGGLMASQITKNAIVKAFEKLVKTIPLKNLTVGEIAKEAGVNRQTFYYHFHDIYDLALYNAKIIVHSELKDENDFSTFLMKLYNLMMDRKSSVLNLYHHSERYELKRIFLETFHDVSDNLVTEASMDKRLPAEEHEIAVRFTMFMTAEFLLTWVDKGMNIDEKRFAMFADILEENMKSTIAFFDN